MILTPEELLDWVDGSDRRGPANGLDMLKRDFAIVRHVKPKASRADSAELYVLATGFRGSS